MTIRARTYEVGDEPVLIARGGWAMVQIVRADTGLVAIGGPDVTYEQGQAVWDPVQLSAQTRASDDLYAVKDPDFEGAETITVSVLAVGYAP